MYVSIRRYNKVVSVREVCRRIAVSFVPLLQKAPGFIAYYAVDCGGGADALRRDALDPAPAGCETVRVG